MRRSTFSKAPRKLPCILRRGSIGEAAVRPSGLVVDAPRLNRALRIDQAHEPVLVEALVPEPAVEAFDVRVLDRLARIDEVEHDAMAVCPLIERLAAKLGAVVTRSPSGTRARQLRGRGHERPA